MDETSLEAFSALYWQRNAPGQPDESDSSAESDADIKIIRSDALTGAQVLYSVSAEARAHKLNMYSSKGARAPRVHEQPIAAGVGPGKKCPFCPGRERTCPMDLLRIESTGEESIGGWAASDGAWQLRVIRNTFPQMVTPTGWYGDASDASLSGEDGKTKFASSALGKVANRTTNPHTAAGLSHSLYSQVDAVGFSEVGSPFKQTYKTKPAQSNKRMPHERVRAHACSYSARTQWRAHANRHAAPRIAGCHRDTASQRLPRHRAARAPRT